MSLKLRRLVSGKEKTRKEILKLATPPKYWDEVTDEETGEVTLRSRGRTKQGFKDHTDINKILNRAATGQSLAHLQKYPEMVYGEFDGECDLLTAHGRIAKAEQIFNDLPSEIRNEFDNDALKFVKFAGDPANNGRLRDLLPAIAEPGSYFPNPIERGGTGAGAATAPAENSAANAAVDTPANPPAGDPAAQATPAAAGGTD